MHVWLRYVFQSHRSGGASHHSYTFNRTNGVSPRPDHASHRRQLLRHHRRHTLPKSAPEALLPPSTPSTSSDGYTPVGLLEADDGNFYGAAEQGGNNSCIFGCGTVFKTNPSGTITTLHAFDGTDGGVPTGRAGARYRRELLRNHQQGRQPAQLSGRLRHDLQARLPALLRSC